MNKKTFCYTPIAIAIMASSFSASAGGIAGPAINSLPDTDITIANSVILNALGTPAVTIDDPIITLNVGTTPNSGASATSDQIAIDVQPNPINGSISDPVINNNGTIEGGTIGIRLDRDANSGGTGDLVNINNVAGSVISGGNRALEIEADTIDLENSGVITLTTPNADTSNGVVFVSDQASNVDIFNRDGGVIDSGEGTEAAAISLQLNNGGRRNDITNDEGGQIIGRGNAAASGSDAGDGIRFERERELSSGQDSSGNNLEDIGTLQATTELFLSQGNVTNAGLISSEGANGTVAGIRVVDNVAFAGTITNESTGVITGEQNGLYFGNADHREIDENGVVEATGTVSNSGTISSGSRALNIDGSNLQITNEVGGQIIGTGVQRNGTVYSDSTAQNFSVNNAGTIDAVVEGSGFAAEIAAEGNTFTFDNSGTIAGRGTVDAADGFRLGNPGNIGTATVEITNSGTISSESTTGTTAGLRFVNGIDFAGTIDNSGTISGAQNGVYFGNAVEGAGADHSNGTFNNLEGGTISSDSRAFNIDGEGLTLNNAGTIIGTGVQRNGTVYSDSTAQNFNVDNSGTIDAVVEGSGFAAEIAAEGNTFTFDNSGTIAGRGTVDAADGFRLGNPGNIGTATVEITNSGTISSESTTGTTAGLRFVNGIDFAGTIDNSGTISGAQNGVYFGNAVEGAGADHSNGTFNNLEGGTISSDSRAFNIDGEGLTLNNAGTIIGTGVQRNGTVYSDSTAQNFSVDNSGTIDAGVEGSGFAAEIAAEGNTFTFDNSGTIAGRGTVDAADGFRLGNPGNIGTATVEITNSGTISSESTTGTTAGLRFVNGIDFAGTIDNSGTISGAQNGVYFGNAVEGAGADHSNGVFNNLEGGTISSDSRAFNIDGEGLTVNNSGSILATGSQRNGTVYVDATANNFTFNNLSGGLVDGGEGNESSALSIQVGDSSGDIQAASINNEGTLQGRGTGVSAGIRLFTSTEGATFSGDIINSGDIFAEDSAGILIQSGVTLDGSIDNTGNISSTGGTAVDFSENATGITFNQNSGDINGSILLGSGSDTINIAGGSVSGDITGLGNGIVNIDLGAGNTFTSNGVFNVQDYNILSGTVNQAGNFSTASATTTVASGATLAFDSEINGSGALVSDGTLSFGLNGRLIQDGDVTLNDGSTVAFLFEDALNTGDQVTLIDATTITNNGVNIVDDSVLLDLEATFNLDGDLIVEAVSADVDGGEVIVGDVVLDDNTQAFASALSQTIADGNPALLANVAELQSAGIADLNALTPSLSGAATLGAFQLNDAALKLVRNQYASGNTASELKNGLWVNGLSGSSDQDDQNGISGFDSDLDGFGIGYNLQLNKTRLGVAYNSSDAEISNNIGAIDTDIDSDQIAVFADYQTDNWFVGGSLSYSDLEYDFNRTSTLDGVSGVSASTDGNLFDASVNFGYKLNNFTPIASISYSTLDIDSFDEIGGVGITDVNYADVDRFRSELGVLFNSDNKYGAWTISPNLKLAWSHDFEDDATELSAQVGGISFDQIGNELDSDVINVGAGVTFANDNGWNLRFDYQGAFSSDEDSQFGSASVEYRF